MADFASSPYSGTFDGNDLGCTVDGYKYQVDGKWEDVKTDCGGDTILDRINRGMAVSIKCTFAECGNTDVASLMEFFSVDSTGLSIGADATSTIGQFLVQDGIAKELVLTPRISGAGDTLTFPFASPDTSSMNLNSKLRTLEITFTIYPDPTTGIFGTSA